MIHATTLYDFDDLLIRPENLTKPRTRKYLNPLTEDGFLPLFTAPMDTVVDEENADVFLQNKIRTVLPRLTNAKGYVSYDKNKWDSYSLDQFKSTFIDCEIKHPEGNPPMYALIDVANGHMEYIYELVKHAKIKHKNLVLMVGNIANPATYNIAAQAGADYVRIGIGNGNACLTTEQTGVGYPMASLIDHCREIKREYGYKAKIVADGGMKKYSDIIKALALGADYVMLGSILNKAYESCAPCYVHCGNDYYRLYEEFAKEQEEKNRMESILFNAKFDFDKPKYETYIQQGILFKQFRGMSTKEVQRSWGREESELKTSEGVVKYQAVEYTLEKWVKNFQDYLCTAMSYTNSETLDDFIGGCDLMVISNNALKRYNK